MNLNQWLDAGAGRGAALAAHLNRTPSAISQWRDNGVPVSLMQVVHDFSAGEMSVAELVAEATTLREARKAAPAQAAEQGA